MWIGNEMSIFLGRLTRNIALLSKELPKSLLLSAEANPIFELRSRINKGKRIILMYYMYLSFIFFLFRSQIYDYTNRINWHFSSSA